MSSGIRKSSRIAKPTLSSTKTNAGSSSTANNNASATSTNDTTSRRSARSNKYSNSMKEPTESVSDLLRGGDLYLPNGSSNTSNNRKKQRMTSTTTSSTPTKSSFLSRSSNSRRSNSTRTRNSNNVKSPVVSRHTRARRQMKIEIEPSDSDESDENVDEEEEEEEEVVVEEYEEEYDDEEEVEEEDDDEDIEIKIQRIIAVRSESKRKWKEICNKVNTSEVENGSRWFQHNNGDNDNDDQDDDDMFEERFLVKWADLSFLHCSWETKDDLIEQVDGAKTYFSTFFRKSVNGFLYDADDRLDGDYFDPAFTQIDRILEVHLPESFNEQKRQRWKQQLNGDKMNDNKWGIIFDREHPDYDQESGRQFLIKWGNSSYSDATYEYERDLIFMDVEYESHVDSFLKRNKKPSKSIMKRNFAIEEEERRRMYKIFGDRIPDGEEKEKSIQDFKHKLEEMEFQNGGKLRDYQAEGVSWLLANHINKRSAILADEMGLGKTIQTATYIYMVHSLLCSRGPFLIVAPLSTIPHWQREFVGWTGMNTIVYHGSAKDREVIREFEFPFECDRPQGGIGMNQRYLKKCHHRNASRSEKIWMAQVVITTPEMLVTEDFSELKAVKWDVLVVDEAHRLKNHNSKLALNLRADDFDFNHSLLLTGTPIQNNMNELWTLMNFIDPDEFEDCDNFMEKYGNMKSKENVDGLHSVIRPYILRRLKEDVEKSVPPKEETLIEVELTLVQKQYYRALYEKNVQFLHKGVKKALDGPSLNNLAMQLRKCCNHPFLLNGVEETVKRGKEHKTKEEEADFLVMSSGKLVLLDKLLPKLKENGHRILIFSQFKIMLDILEDYLDLRKFKAERIDGSITGKKRQMAIDRFQSETSDSFIMLLSTKAGGVGINLTAADTCIIFDSDWNPQNDLQAQARCHRIGQTKSVKVYRLLTRKTYEIQMFHMSSLKMGLDQAVLQGIENGTNNDQSLSKEEVEKLLRCGAYDIFSEEQNGVSEKESSDFIEQDIDSILARRTKTVIHENTGSKSNAAGGTFSKASFTSKGGSGTPGKDIDIDDPDFWTKMIGEAKVIEDDEYIIKSGNKRARKNANYNEKLLRSELDSQIMISGDESDSDDSASSADSKFTDTQDQTYEYNLGFDSTRRNKILNELLVLKREEITERERRRWGGTKKDEWFINDAELVLSCLHKYGYNNVKWDVFYERFRRDASKEYDMEEVMRMCWALSLTTIIESVYNDVNEVAKRLEKATKKRKEQEENHPESVMAVSTTTINESSTNSIEWKEEQTKNSFKKIWEANKWAGDAILDAIAFAERTTPRDASIFDEEHHVASMEKTPLLDSFVDNIWPALRNRGWEEQVIHDSDNRNGKWISPQGKNFQYVDDILDELPTMYPELSETISSVIETVAKKKTMNKSSTKPQTKVLLDPNVVDAKNLGIFLKQFSPIQLLIDRVKSRSLSLPRRTLDVLSHLRKAHILVRHVDSHPDASSISIAEKYFRLSKLLNVSPKATLPHPSWKPYHDAVLVAAIAKHGWIDKESNCRDIINDKDVKWGEPFGEGDMTVTGVNQSDSSSSEDVPSFNKEKFKEVALRVISFLEGVKDTNELKGFNLNLVLKTYAIESNKQINQDGQAEISWKFDPTLKECKTTSVKSTDRNLKSDSFVELPTRKDLLKRAKIILGNTKPTSTGEEDTGANHNFIVLDQGNIYNIFLAELLREVVKLNQKTIRVGRKALSCALMEINHRLDSMNDDDEDEYDDFCKLKNQIKLAACHLKKKISRPAKNIIRAILGLQLVNPMNPGDEMFVVEKYSNANRNIEDTSYKSKIASKKSSESALGDQAINKAIAVAKGIAKNGDSNECSNMLGIATIETLMLSVMCSQGIPVYDENWKKLLESDDDVELSSDDEYLLDWCHVGHVLEVAAAKWVEISQLNFNKIRSQGLDTSPLERELKVRMNAHEIAQELHATPLHLAKKSIMLIEAIRQHMGECKQKGRNSMKAEYGIGISVLQWNKKHLNKWARAIEVTDDGKTRAVVAMSINKDGTAASGYLDKKNCKAVYTQISQQTRLRSLFAKYDNSKLLSMVSKALKNVKRSGDVWEDQPSWWAREVNPNADDFDLLSGVLQFGYGGFDQMVMDNERFHQLTSLDGSQNRLYRSSGQQRVNSLTRELSKMDDISENLRLVNEKKNNAALKQPNSSDKDIKHGSGNTRQVGIDAFFGPTKSSAPKDELEISDDEIQIVGVVIPPKRKTGKEPTSSSGSQQKKRKT